VKPQDLGRKGEELAETFLSSRGWTILGKNLRSGRLEIDILAARGRVVAIVEVKARAGPSFGHPLEAITRRKRAEVARAARGILGRLKLPPGCVLRFDAVAVEWGGSDSPRVTHVPDAWRLD
jgi:putative endonuclease